MGFPVTLNASVPPDSESPRAGALRIRNLTQAILDLLGLTSGTPVTAPPFSISPSGVVSFPQGNPGTILTNNTGVTLSAGNAVSFDATTDNAVALSDVSGSLVDFVIALQTIAPAAQGSFSQQGVTPIASVTGAVTRGHYLKKSATTLVLEDTGTAMASGTAAPQGSVAVALTGTAGPGAGTVAAYLLGATTGGSGTAGMLAGARVFNSATQSLAGGSTVLTFNSTRFNRNAVWAGGSPTRLTAPTTGIYMIGGHLVVTSSGQFGLWVRLNGATQITPQVFSTAGGPTAQTSIATSYLLNAADYVELMAQNPGGTVNSVAAGNYSPEFYAQMVSS